MPREIDKKARRIRDIKIYCEATHRKTPINYIAFDYGLTYNRVYQIIRHFDRCFRMHRKQYEKETQNNRMDNNS